MNEPPLLVPPPDDPGAVIAVRELVKRFGNFAAVDRVSFDIHPGEVFGLLGPNGSGKTTAIRMMCGLLSPTSGTIRVAGVDVVAEPDRVKSRLGYMSQAFGLYRDLTVEENLRFYAGVYEVGADSAERIAWAIEAMRLSEVGRRLAGKLSGGYRQRLALGCALLHRPPVVFLDEPTAGVDPAARRVFWEIIRGLAASATTMIVTTHYMDEAERFDRLAMLSRGHLTALGTPAEVKAAFGTNVTLEDIFVQLQEKSE
jgi:ABC-2 type transport system ATP-binding protein